MKRFLTVLWTLCLLLPFKGYSQQNRMPDLHFTDTDRKAVGRADIAKGRALLLVYFRSDCDHCIHTATQLQKTANTYPCELWMVSGEDSKQVFDFESMMALYDIPNLKVLLDTQHQMHRFFDFTQLPFIVLYGADGRLRKTFAELPSAATVRKILNSK